jgi:histidine triad (HIT) family protein
MYSDDVVTVFRDARPRAPVHVLIVTNRHIASLDEIGEADEKMTGHVLRVARDIARQEKLANGYRVRINVGPGGGQEVYHLHVHVLGTPAE